MTGRLVVAAAIFASVILYVAIPFAWHRFRRWNWYRRR